MIPIDTSITCPRCHLCWLKLGSNTQRSPQKQPRWPQDCPRGLESAPRELQEESRDGPKKKIAPIPRKAYMLQYVAICACFVSTASGTAQEATNGYHHRSKTRLEPPKMAPRQPKKAPIRPNKRPRRHKRDPTELQKGTTQQGELELTITNMSSPPPSPAPRGTPQRPAMTRETASRRQGTPQEAPKRPNTVPQHPPTKEGPQRPSRSSPKMDLFILIPLSGVGGMAQTSRRISCTHICRPAVPTAFQYATPSKVQWTGFNRFPMVPLAWLWQASVSRTQSWSSRMNRLALSASANPERDSLSQPVNALGPCLSTGTQGLKVKSTRNSANLNWTVSL